MGVSWLIQMFPHQGRQLDAHLSAQERAELVAFVSMVEGQLHSALLYSWFFVEDNYYQVIKPVYSMASSFPANLILPWVVR